MKVEPKLKIALVEYDRGIRNKWATLLKQEGFEICCFNTSMEFLKSYTGKEYDIIISEINLPYNGKKLLEKIQEINPVQPFILLSTADDPRLKVFPFVVAKQEGCTEINVKTIKKRYTDVMKNPTKALLQASLMTL